MAALRRDDRTGKANSPKPTQSYGEAVHLSIDLLWQREIFKPVPDVNCTHLGGLSEAIAELRNEASSIPFSLARIGDETIRFANFAQVISGWSVHFVTFGKSSSLTSVV